MLTNPSELIKLPEINELDYDLCMAIGGLPMKVDNFYAFLKYLEERHNIYVRKSNGEKKPWTDFPIFQNYSFTNVKREWDKTTAWAVKNWYDPNLNSPRETRLMNCAIFRWFGTIEFAQAAGFSTQWDPERLKEIARQRIANKQKVFTGAYVITNGGIPGPKQNVVVDEYLTPFVRRIPEILSIADRTKKWEEVSYWIQGHCSGFGGSGFMTKEVLLDALLARALGDVTDKDTYSPIGPGAMRGIIRMMNDDLALPSEIMPKAKAYSLMRHIWNFVSLVMKDCKAPIKFNLSDIQFSLCEFDKYHRTRRGEGRPRSTYQGAR